MLAVCLPLFRPPWMEVRHFPIGGKIEAARLVVRAA